jgi:hypothetical protein
VLPLDQDLTGKGLGAGAVEHVDVGEQQAAHDLLRGLPQAGILFLGGTYRNDTRDV